MVPLSIFFTSFILKLYGKKDQNTKFCLWGEFEFFPAPHRAQNRGSLFLSTVFRVAGKPWGRWFPCSKISLQCSKRAETSPIQRTHGYSKLTEYEGKRTTLGRDRALGTHYFDVILNIIGGVFVEATKGSMIQNRKSSTNWSLSAQSSPFAFIWSTSL